MKHLIKQIKLVAIIWKMFIQVANIINRVVAGRKICWYCDGHNMPLLLQLQLTTLNVP